MPLVKLCRVLNKKQTSKYGEIGLGGRRKAFRVRVEDTNQNVMKSSRKTFIKKWNSKSSC